MTLQGIFSIGIDDFVRETFSVEDFPSPIDVLPAASADLQPTERTVDGLKLNQPARIADPQQYSFAAKHEAVLFSHPMYASARSDITGSLTRLNWQERQLGRIQITPGEPDWTGAHWFFRLSDSEDMKNGTDWQGMDQFGIFQDEAILEDMEKDLILNNWISSDNDFLPIAAIDNISSYTVSNGGGALTIQSVGADSVRNYVQTRFNPRRRISINSSPGGGIVDNEDVTHRYINFTLESDTPGTLIEVQLGWRYLSSVSNGRGILDLTKLIDIYKINEPIEYFIDISDTVLYDTNVTGVIPDTEPPPTLAYFALKVVDPKPFNLKLYRIRAINGIFSAKTVTPTDNNIKKGKETSDLGTIRGGRFVQLMLVLSTTNPPMSPEIESVNFSVTEGQGSLPLASQMVQGGIAKWVDPDTTPKFALIDHVHKDFS